MNIFVSCAIGLEPVLADEISNIISCKDADDFGAAEVKPTKAGVSLEGDLETAYRLCLWSRVASRVLLPLFECDATVDDLYHSAVEQNWAEYLQPGTAIAIDFSGKNKHIRHTRFGALKIKDAIADWHQARDLDVPYLDLSLIHI